MRRSKGVISSGVQHDVTHPLCVLISLLHSGHVCARDSPPPSLALATPL